MVHGNPNQISKTQIQSGLNNIVFAKTSEPTNVDNSYNLDFPEGNICNPLDVENESQVFKVQKQPDRLTYT